MEYFRIETSKIENVRFLSYQGILVAYQGYHNVINAETSCIPSSCSIQPPTCLLQAIIPQIVQNATRKTHFALNACFLFDPTTEQGNVQARWRGRWNDGSKTAAHPCGEHGLRRGGDRRCPVSKMLVQRGGLSVYTRLWRTVLTDRAGSFRMQEIAPRLVLVSFRSPQRQ